MLFLDPCSFVADGSASKKNLSSLLLASMSETCICKDESVVTFIAKNTFYSYIKEKFRDLACVGSELFVDIVCIVYTYIDSSNSLLLLQRY